ncbi:MAG: heparinase II/III family protein, partial [Armatimonadetes bacterium]|nr:heparinase II/III family protein [Armatimonadota bacterium]
MRMLTIAVCLAWAGVAAGQGVVLSDAETTTNWRGVALIDDAKVGQHAVRHSLAVGPGGPSLNFASLEVLPQASDDLVFWYRFSGRGSSNLMIKLVANPFAEGWQATWEVAPRREADGQWHAVRLDLSTTWLKWGDKPDLTSRLVMFRTEGSAGSQLTLDLDQVRLVPRRYTVKLAGVEVAGARVTARVEARNLSREAVNLELRAGERRQPWTVPAEGQATAAIDLDLAAGWLAEAPPLATCQLAVTVAAGEDSQELMVTVAKPLDLPPHPRLLANPERLAAIKAKAAAAPWAAAALGAIRTNADRWLTREVVLPPRGGQWWHYYACKDDGGRLQTVSPTEHKCSVCGKVYSGWPYDDVVLDRQHSGLANGLRDCGLIYALSGDARYAAKAREILLAYADRYTRYELHNIQGKAAVGGGRVGPQTLDESTWLIPMSQGADFIWESLSAEDRARAEHGLFRPATEVIRQHRMSIHNIQCWKNSAVGLVGLLLGDQELVADAVTSDHGFQQQVARGISADGQWYEGAWGYHFYTVSAMLPLVEAAGHCGLDLARWEKDGRSYRRLFDGPLDLATPALLLPAFNDSGQVGLKGNGSFEAALGYYGDPRFAAVLEGSKRENLIALIHGPAVLPQPPAALSSSRNYPGSGYSILTNGSGKEAPWLCLKYGPHGGGHGHPDKLNLVLFRDVAVGYDPGTAAYGVPIQAEWYRTTLAHNTLTVDEANQKEATGRSLAFAARPGLGVALAEAGAIYPGVTYRRAVALCGEKLMLVLDLVEAAQEHTFDLAWHNAGAWAMAPPGAPLELPAKPGYKHLRGMVRSAGPLPAIKVTDSLTVGVSVGGGGETLAGTGVGRNANDRVPVVIQRLRGRQAVVGWAVVLGGEAVPV